ncbi:MAG: OmpA family protein [Phycisphaerales bacterium]|nr:OmpA family protein [Phycisphaerales bacterium]
MQSGVKTSVLGRSGVKVLGLMVLGFGLVLGGCNNSLKKENEDLRTQNAEIKQQADASAAEKAALAAQMESIRAENARLAQMQTQVVQQPPAPIPSGDGFNGGGGSGKRDGGIRQTRNNTIEISSDVLFTPGSASLKPDARRELDRYLSRLRSASNITIEGHTDSDPIRKSKWGSNQALSKARADAVRDYLASKGVSRSKIDTVGKGSSEPKGTKAQSRRVDIVVGE